MSELSSIEGGSTARPGSGEGVAPGVRRAGPETGPVRGREAGEAGPRPIRRGEDRVELDSRRVGSSAAGRTIGPEEHKTMVRDDLIRDVRERIESGGYLTDDKLEAAVERMLRRVQRG